MATELRARAVTFPVQASRGGSKETDGADTLPRVSTALLVAVAAAVAEHQAVHLLMLKGGGGSANASWVLFAAKAGQSVSPRDSNEALHAPGSATDYEHQEILDYPEIYFVGPNVKKRQAMPGGPNNCGFDDDEQGSYQHVAHEPHRISLSCSEPTMRSQPALADSGSTAILILNLRRQGPASVRCLKPAFDHKYGAHVAPEMVRNEKRVQSTSLPICTVRILELLKRQRREGCRQCSAHFWADLQLRNQRVIVFELLSIEPLRAACGKNRFHGIFAAICVRKVRPLQSCSALRAAANREQNYPLRPQAENILLQVSRRRSRPVNVIDFWQFLPLKHHRDA
uniref:Uncharacterized protein n=1 Tax=Macrostomum lignano TaxID=282301 RepID=A0A1I8FL71_9PLAT